MDNTNTPPTPPTQTTAGFPQAFPGCDVPGDLIPPEWVIDGGNPVAESGPAAPSELEEIRDGLQESLLGGKPRYQAPDLEHLRSLAKHVPIASRNGKAAHPENVAWVGELATTELAERVAVWVHRHRGRGLSDLDLACQREWSARALGVGYFYGRPAPWLPHELVGVCGPRRAPLREQVLAALCLAMVKGRNGICIGAPDAEMLWKIGASTWWACIAWLEKAGLLVRMRRFKNNDVRGQAPVHFCPNWYGPGPVLLGMRKVVFAAFRKGDDEILAELREETRRERCRRRHRINERQVNDRRRREGLPPRPPLGRPAPSWAMRVTAELGAARMEKCERSWAQERARELVAGRVPELGAPPPDPAPELCEETELVLGLMAAGVETEEQLAALVDAQELQPDPPPEPGADAREPVAPVLGASGGPGGGDPVCPVDRAPTDLTVQSTDGAPLGPDTPKIGRAAGQTGSPPPGPPDAPRTGATGSRASAPARPLQPRGGRAGPGGEPIPGAPARGAPRASEGAKAVPPPPPPGSVRADAAHALAELVDRLPAGHPLRGWTPGGAS